MTAENRHTGGVPFEVKDCTLIARMGGVDAVMNLRELRERLAICPVESLFHHFCETLIRPGFDDPEFHNDIAVWVSRFLRDRVLAERLGLLNPYAFEDLEQLRERLIEIIDERLDELPQVPWVHKGEEFHFMRAATIVFSTGIELDSLGDFVECLPLMSRSSIYYHFVEARRRTETRRDDFTAWLEGLNIRPESLIDGFNHLDFYFLNLVELQKALTQATRDFWNREERHGQVA